MKKYLNIIPFYNEEILFYPLQYDDLITAYSDVDFLIIDDASTDNTLNIINNLKVKNPNIKLISLNMNLGKAEAIRSGVLNAISKDYEM